MNETPNPMPQVDPGIPNHAISLYQEQATDDFPVLKAFQQYIDAEQAKARKRMLSLSIFFGIMMTMVIVVFVMLLMNVNQRNQQLSDRLFDYATKDRDRQSPVVVNPPSDNSAVLALASKLEEMQKKLEAAMAKSEQTEKARAEEAERVAAETIAAQKAAQEQIRTKEAEEIIRLKALLAAEQEKSSEAKKQAEAERARQREAELEAYRRKHYPEYYAKLEAEQRAKTAKTIPAELPLLEDEETDPIDDLLDELRDDKAVNYFEDEEDESEDTDVQLKNYTIPVEVKGSRNKWRIPNDD